MSPIETLTGLMTLRLGEDRGCGEMGTDEFCSAGVHLRRRSDRQADRLGRCPAVVRAEIRARIEAEIERLKGVIRWSCAGGGFGLFGYDVGRHPQAQDAHDRAWAFAEGRPPDQHLILAGSPGLGKTRLLLGCHFELLAAGVDSYFVQSSELRQLFRDAAAFDEEVHQPARDQIERLRRAQALHVDDLGDVEGDERARGGFAEGLKGLLDASRAAWAISTNLTGQEFAAHPDLGQKILSRILASAAVVKMRGGDQRLPGGPHAR